MNVKRCGLTVCFFAVLSIPRGAAATEGQVGARMWEQDVTIPTYRTGEPDKDPIFYNGRSYQGAKGPVYPYALLDKLSDEKVDRKYHAVILENPYVQFSILPELGGRVFSGQDRSNGYDFIYRQHVIKPALIGMIGAWISGGIEWDIPHHHRASTFMPVAYRLIENPDGSKTVWLGEIERRERMKWLVGLTIFPDRSYLKATVKLFNRTPLAHSLLYFANVGVPANAGYQVIFPPGTRFGTQHGKSEFIDWPIGHGVYGGLDRSGVDLSWWKNLPTPVSIFAWNHEDDFFGGYDHGKKAGLAIVADHHVAPGKKFFAWGNGPEGEMWSKLLTDADGPYLELMSGGYSDNQPDYSWIEPGEVKVVEQYFYPIRELGGIKNANIDAAVNLDVGDRIRFALNTTSEFRDARVVLQAGDRVLFEKRITISPAQPFVQQLPLPANMKPEDVKVSLIAADGKEIIRYAPAPRASGAKPPRVEPPPAPKEIKTIEELYLAGLRLEQFHNPAREPYPYYEEALRRDPRDYRSNVALGILACKRGLYLEAEKHLAVAVQRVSRNYTRPKDGEALYYLGVALRGQGKAKQSDDAFHEAAWDLAWNGAANVALAESAGRRGDWSKALEFIDRAIAVGTMNTKALSLKTALLRKLKRSEEAVDLAEQALKIDPLDAWAACERRKLRSSATQDAVLSSILSSDAQACLELAADYGNCGMYDDAVETLHQIIAVSADKSRIDPMVYYFLGYYCLKKGLEADADAAFQLAERMSPDHCFPFQLESIDVLRTAMARNPRDARAACYLGNLLYDIQPEAAVRAWERARDLDGKWALVHRNLGWAYAHAQHDNAKAIASLEAAVACNSQDPRLYAELDGLYDDVNAEPSKRLALLERNHATVANRDDALLREISLLILLGRYDRALELMQDHHFRLWEGETGVHDVYVGALMLRGQQSLKAGSYAAARKDFQAALEYPERFETAKDRRGQGHWAEIDYFFGVLSEAEGKSSDARRHFEQSVATKAGAPEMRYYQALAARKLGQDAKAAELWDGLIRTGRERLRAAGELDFFAKFGTRQSASVRTADAYWFIGLGLLGKGQTADARKQFEAALQSHASHLGARVMLAATKE
jgi:tetratricopeptide (TPR) repeat protein